jgi:hypothetical protein
VHWELFNHATYRAGLPASVTWTRAERIDLLGRTVLYLAPADELRYLCVHFAAEHQLRPLIWAVDIAELVGRLPASWDWASFVEETIEARLAWPVALSLRFCQKQLHLQLSDRVVDALWDAGQSTAERAAWSAAQSPYLSRDWVLAHIATTHGLLEWAIFLRGALLPRGPALAAMYGQLGPHWRDRVQLQWRHLWRLSLDLFQSLRSKTPLTKRCG